MPKRINVISSELDGAELKREQMKNSYFSRCSGIKDDGQVNDAVEYSTTSKFYSISSEAWNRVFGGKHGDN